MFRTNRTIRQETGPERPRRRRSQQLGDLPDHLLRDIGMTIGVSNKYWRER